MADRFRIYYSDSELEGTGRDDWIAAPDDDVQVVRLFAPPAYPLPDRSTGYVHCGLPDRMLYTGVDKYDTLGFGVKHGSLLSDAAYQAVWDRAYGDD